MFLLNIKSIRFLLFCLSFSAGLTTVLAQETPLQDSVETNLDLEALLAAIKHHDALLKSAAGDIVYTQGQPPFDTDTSTGKIAFDVEKTRFDSQRGITILTPTTMWEIDPDAKRLSNYHFSTEPMLIPPDVDPRRWLTLWNKDLATYLKTENFHITGREFINDIHCYVLEAKQGDSSTKLWIAPQRGFRYLKYESQSPRPVDALDSDIPMEALTVDRIIVSYEKFGETWFPKTVFRELAWLDFQATNPIIFRQTLEINNLKVNHDIPSETFTVDLPEDATVLVNRQILSKEEFLKRYAELLPQPTDPIRNQ